MSGSTWGVLCQRLLCENRRESVGKEGSHHLRLLGAVEWHRCGRVLATCCVIEMGWSGVEVGGLILTVRLGLTNLGHKAPRLVSRLPLLGFGLNEGNHWA